MSKKKKFDIFKNLGSFDFSDFDIDEFDFSSMEISDKDLDGVRDAVDCQPGNPYKQDDNKVNWIEGAIENEGALSRSLGIPQSKNIPMSLLDKIIESDPPEMINNPTQVGKRKIYVTRKMEQRAILARNLKNMTR